MGFSTTFLGRLDIEPRLNPAEVEWLRAYADLDRRYFIDPYEVPMNPKAFRLERERQPDASTTLRPGDGSPYPHLDWNPCIDGCCLSWDGRTEKSRMAEEWLQYLIDHFLRPGARARTSAKPDFAQFTFDHVLNGVIAAERDDTRAMWLIRCRDNEISTEQLVPPDAMPWELGSWA